MDLGELFVQIGAIGNSKEIKAFGEAVKKAGKAIDDYDKKVKKSEGRGKKFNATLKGTVGVVTAVIGALAGAYWALDRLTDSLAKQNLQWLNLTRQSDIALSTFQKWGTIGKIVGVDNAAQQLENLNQKIFNLRLTGEGAKGFQMAGIMPTNADDVLEQLRTRISGMNNTAATYLLQQMGLDPKMITLLRMGREEWEEYLRVQRQYTLNENQRKDIDRMNRQLEVAKIKMQYFKDKAILALMPAFTKFTQSLVRVTELLIKFIKHSWRVIGILVFWGQKFKPVRDFFSHINSSLGGAISKIPLFGRAFAQLGKVFSRALLPLTALYLILDDLAVFFEGGDSLIGRVLNWGKEKGGDIAEGFKQMFGGDFLGGLGKTLETLLDSLIDILETISTLLEGLVNFLTFGLMGKFRDSKVGQWLFPDVSKSMEWAKKYSPNSAMSPITRYTTSTTNRNQNTTINQTNYIQTSETSSQLDWSLRFWQQQAAK